MTRSQRTGALLLLAVAGLAGWLWHERQPATADRSIVLSLAGGQQSGVLALKVVAAQAAGPVLITWGDGARPDQFRLPPGNRIAALDVSASRYAGELVSLRASARDAGGRALGSAPLRLRLPARLFNNTQARAVLAVRRSLMADNPFPALLATRLDRLSRDIAKEGGHLAAYVQLRSLHYRLQGPLSPAELDRCAALLWLVARDLEGQERDPYAIAGGILPDGTAFTPYSVP